MYVLLGGCFPLSAGSQDPRIERETGWTAPTGSLLSSHLSLLMPTVNVLVGCSNAVASSNSLRSGKGVWYGLCVCFWAQFEKTAGPKLTVYGKIEQR